MMQPRRALVCVAVAAAGICHVAAFSISTSRLSPSFSTPTRAVPQMVASWFKPAPTRNTQAEAAELKKIIYTAAKGTDNGIKASDAQREAIKGAINKLVKINPTKAPAKSDKSTGVWNLVYTTSSESSAGKLGPFVGKVTQDVDVSTVKYVNVVDLGLVRGELGATWTVENASQWKVIFQNIKFSVLGVALLNKEISAEGLWTLSYLDDDFRILTARSLARNDGGNVYILAKGA